MTAIGRLDQGDSRWYVDPLDSDLRYSSVTTILGAATSKPWLIQWGSKLAAEFAVHQHELVNQTITAAGKPAAVDLIKGAAKRARELMAEIGQYQHDVLEAFLLDLPIPSVPDHLRDVEIDGEALDLDAISDGIVNFLTDFGVLPADVLMSEATVANVFYSYAGTLDTIITLRCLGRTLLIDLKTGRILDPGMNAQMAAYRRADEVWLPFGRKAPMPQVDGCAVLHVRRDYAQGYKLIEVPADDDAFAWFRACQVVLEHQQKQPKIKGNPIYPPLPDGSQPAPLLEDLQHDGLGRCVGPLAAADPPVRSLTDLAGLSAAECVGIKGIGPKSLLALEALLKVHGLTFRADPLLDAVAAEEGAA